MEAQTEQLVATLEVLTENLNFEVPRENDNYHPITPIIWQTATQGELNSFNLIVSQGLCRLTEAEKVIEKWLEIEVRGTPTSDDYYAPEPEDREYGLSNEIQAARKIKYQKLWELLSTELHNLKAYELSRLESDYAYYIIVGESKENDWLGISVTIPQQTQIKPEEIAFVPKQASFESTKPSTRQLVANLEDIINNLPSMTIYGYHEGGYDYTYKHKVIYSVAPTQAQVIETAGDGIYVASFEGFYPEDDYFVAECMCDAKEIEAKELYQRYQILNKFLHQKLSNLTLFRFCFWDWDYIYILGETTISDWVGIQTTNEFVYNP